MPQRVLADREAPVPDDALVDRAPHRPSSEATRSALTTPSSWKPQPQYAPQKCVRLCRPLISSCRACARAPAVVNTGWAYEIVFRIFEGSMASVRFSVTQNSRSAVSDCRRFIWDGTVVAPTGGSGRGGF